MYGLTWDLQSLLNRVMFGLTLDLKSFLKRVMYGLTLDLKSLLRRVMLRCTMGSSLWNLSIFSIEKKNKEKNPGTVPTNSLLKFCCFCLYYEPALLQLDPKTRKTNTIVMLLHEFYVNCG
jgi:hypothetical protein